MRKLLSLALVLGSVFVVADARPLQDQNSPIARKIREMDAQTDFNLPVPVIRRKIEPAELRAQAEQIARLAQFIAPQVQQATQGALPKDLGQNLKQIEKLAKHLRRDLNL